MRKRGGDGDVNWEALKTLSNRIRDHIRKLLAEGKVPGRPVLPQALGLARTGCALKLATQTKWAFALLLESKPGRTSRFS